MRSLDKLGMTTWGIWGDSLLSGIIGESRNLNRRNCPPGSLLVSVDLTSDETSATGGRQRFALHYGRDDIVGYMEFLSGFEDL